VSEATSAQSIAKAARSRAAPAILNAGALAGFLDIMAASIQAMLAGRSPMRMLQGIASGWLGKATTSYGWWSAALGLVSHFFIATTWAAIYWLASRRVPALARKPWVWGAVYGVFVYFFMQEVVIPLSAIHRHLPRDPQNLIKGLLIHIACVGWPIALVIRARTPRRDISAT
jgi:uncharacterized membrane protein YagU involved in acid resistance